MSIASSIIGGFRRTTTPIRRPGAVSIVDGRAVPGAETTVQVLAAIFPAKASRLLREVEGESQGGAIKVYSADLVKVGDLVDWNGATYEVDVVDFYEDGGLYDATATRRRVT